MKTQYLLGVKATRQAFNYSRFIQTLPNPNDVIAQAGDLVATFDNIKTDPQVASGIQQRQAGVKALLWEIQSNTDNNPYVDFIKSVFDNLDIDKIISEMLNAPLQGMQPMEIYWHYKSINDKAYLVPADIVGKPMSWFNFDSNNLPRLMTNEHPRGELLPHRKFLILQHLPSYDNPYGTAILSRCLWPVVFKKGGLTFWVKFSEKYGMPHLIGKTDSPDKEDFLEKLDELTQDASTVIDTTDSIEALNNISSIQVNIFKELIEHCNTEISKAILSQTLTTEVTTGGNYATGSVHAGVLESIIKSDSKIIENAFNKLIRWIIELNFGENIEPPKFVMYSEEDVDAALATVVNTLTTNGQIRFTKKFYTERFGFKDDEFDIIEAQQPAEAFAEEKPIDSSSAATPEGNKAKTVYADQTLVDAFVDRAIKENSPLYEVLTSVLVEFVDKQSDFESAKKKLAALLPDMDTSAIEQKLTNLLFMADVIGRLSVQQENANG